MSALDQVPMSREEFLAMFHRGATLRATAYALGLTDEQMGLALLEAQHAAIQDRTERRFAKAVLDAVVAPLRPIDESKTFCSQCDRLVHRKELIACQSRWCDKHKGQAA